MNHQKQIKKISTSGITKHALRKVLNYEKIQLMDNDNIYNESMP